MKKQIITIKVLILFLVSLVSCDSLDLGPLDYYGSENFWQNEAQVEGYVLGVHSQVRGLHSTLWLLGEARGGLHKHGLSSTGTSLNDSSPVKDQDFTKDKTGISGWGGFYQRILSINLGINKLENEADFLTDDSKNYYLGQLYGLRAFLYSYLYKTYGGVPVVTEPKVMQGENSAEPLYTERSTPKQVLDFIKSDLEKSENYFGSNIEIKNQKGSWSKYATLMLKADIYLWSAKVTTGDQTPASNDLTVAESALNEVKGKFSLLDDYSSVFEYDNKGNDEIIFALRFLETEATTFHYLFRYQQNLIAGKYLADGSQSSDPLNTKGNGLLRHEYIFPLFESYDELDSRKYSIFLDIYDKDEETGELIDGGTIMRKFLGLINADGNRVYSDDIPVYRYADVLLMLAEVENMKGGNPAQYINMIRQRAYGDNYSPAEHAYTNGDFATNERAILAERDKEFVCEGKRWFDVRRMHDASGDPLVFSDAVNYGNPAVLSTGEAHKLLWPVDVNTLNVDPKLEQTPGY
ncbi:Starch-binding associating with outer membrane [Tangfeifania diversioriginum]|uniref:Starch-binding associating with outer membrane n=1 Tax=Tangfeifania diversioriginum TaxID=1168035 RepID=A0A1M6IF92_9BACT|nr:RagB/SusD family nutrient uptake outer membrane protein [Tangfeifania diversioriginum]SHJ33111.1 Starch-binding associating with outer membrane [Tangfeifania diversioriginum]